MLVYIIKCLEEGIYTGGFKEDGEVFRRNLINFSHNQFVKTEWNSNFKYNFIFDYKNEKIELDIRNARNDELIYSCEVVNRHVWDLYQLAKGSGFIYTDGFKNLSVIDYCK